MGTILADRKQFRPQKQKETTNAWRQQRHSCAICILGTVAPQGQDKHEAAAPREGVRSRLPYGAFVTARGGSTQGRREVPAAVRNVCYSLRRRHRAEEATPCARRSRGTARAQLRPLPARRGSPESASPPVCQQVETVSCPRRSSPPAPCCACAVTHCAARAPLSESSLVPFALLSPAAYVHAFLLGVFMFQ